MAIVEYRLPGVCTDTTKPILRRDPMLDGQPEGAFPFVFDLFADYEASHAAAAYTNGQAITNLAGGTDGSMVVNSGETISSRTDSGGADFSAITTDASYIAAPAGTLADIWAGDQYWMVFFWAMLPSEADWVDDSPINPFFCASADSETYLTGADLVTISQIWSASTKRLAAYRQIDLSSGNQELITPGAYGVWSQVAYWKDADGEHLRIKRPGQAAQTSSGSGADNDQDFSALVPKWGITGSWWNTAGNPEQLDSSNFAIARGGICNLELLADYTPTQWLDADATLIEARISANSW